LRIAVIGAAVVAALALAPGAAQAAGGDCIWVNTEGELNAYEEGSYLSIQFPDGSWDTWRCMNGSWQHIDLQ
jgi:hypothetical protein